jgi:hypothetical protein
MHAAITAGNNNPIRTGGCSREHLIFKITDARALDLFKFDTAVHEQAANGFGTASGASPAGGRVYEKWDGAFLHHWVAQSAGLQMLQCTPVLYQITCFDKC